MLNSKSQGENVTQEAQRLRRNAWSKQQQARTASLAGVAFTERLLGLEIDNSASSSLGLYVCLGPSCAYASF
jgi:hypothetical protein